MGKSHTDKRTQLSDRLDEAEYNCEKGRCNWCGADSEMLEKERIARISDLKHTLHRCNECGELTATYYWNGTEWRAAAMSDDKYTVVAGKS